MDGGRAFARVPHSASLSCVPFSRTQSRLRIFPIIIPWPCNRPRAPRTLALRTSHPNPKTHHAPPPRPRITAHAEDPEGVAHRRWTIPRRAAIDHENVSELQNRYWPGAMPIVFRFARFDLDDEWRVQRLRGRQSVPRRRPPSLPVSSPRGGGERARIERCPGPTDCS